MSSRPFSPNKTMSMLVVTDEFIAYRATGWEEKRAEKKFLCPSVQPLVWRSGCSPAEPYPPHKRDKCITSAELRILTNSRIALGNIFIW